jgi:1-phosphofructokinase family hexose kinase
LIVTLTINPAVDRNIMTDRLVFEDRSYILDRSDSPGGRGIIASRVLHSFGSKTLSIVTSGGKIGAQLEKLLADSGFPAEVVRIAHPTRVDFAITDKQGLTIKLNEFGPPISEEELDRVEKAVERRMDKASWLMLCGSIPPGVAPDFYCKLIRMARQRGVSTLLDTDGEAMLRGVEEGPTVVKPNQQEAERLLNRALITRAHFREAVTRIRAMGAGSVILSLGSRGAIASDANRMFEVAAPHVDALSPIGAGDALAAAFVWANTKKKEFPDCVRWGVAAGTATAKLPGMESANLEQTKAVYKLVEVRGFD